MTSNNEWALQKQMKARKSHHYWATVIADSFTTALCNVMVENNVSQSALAKKSGVTRAYISKVLSGKTNFTVESMAKLALALGYKVDDIGLSEINESRATKPQYVIYGKAKIFNMTPKKCSNDPVYSHGFKDYKAAINSDLDIRYGEVT
jgi:transcriptional regulator with XRE-family HTH domain